MTQYATFDRRSILIATMLLGVMILLSGGMALYILSDPGLKHAFHMVTVARLVEEHHAGEVDWDHLVISGRRAMMDVLDRYSGYVSPAEFEEKRQQREGHYGGIGVTVTGHDDGLRIYSVRDDGPGKAAGLLSGDIIVAADSNLLADRTPNEATLFLRGEDGTSVMLQVYRPCDDDSLEIVVERREVAYRHVVYAGYTPDSVVYIRLTDFAPGAADEVASALDSLAGPESAARGLILDLRGNPGGLFVEAHATASLFLEDGLFVVGTDGRSRWNDEIFYADGDDRAHGLPMAVLVDRNSASASEIVAGALQQNNRAILVGDTTFGKGLVQGYLRFFEDDGLRLTISRYYFEGGIYLNDFDSMLHETGHGLPPDCYYVSPTSDDYIRALENSFLLHRFAHNNQAEIIAHAERGGLDDIWIEQLADSVKDEFEYPSELTRRADSLIVLAELESGSEQVQAMASGLAELARAHDRRRLFEYKPYLKMRLVQLAFERAYSTYRAYDEVVVKGLDQIAFAAKRIELR